MSAWEGTLDGVATSMDRVLPPGVGASFPKRRSRWSPAGCCFHQHPRRRRRLRTRSASCLGTSRRRKSCLASGRAITPPLPLNSYGSRFLPSSSLHLPISRRRPVGTTTNPSWGLGAGRGGAKQQDCYCGFSLVYLKHGSSRVPDN